MAWRAAKAFPFGFRFWNANIYDGNEHIASAHGETREKAQRNAHLMAAAPEMLEALEAVEEAFNTWLPAIPIGDYHRAAEKGRAALRKARGEEVPHEDPDSPGSR